MLRPVSAMARAPDYGIPQIADVTAPTYLGRSIPPFVHPFESRER